MADLLCHRQAAAGIRSRETMQRSPLSHDIVRCNSLDNTTLLTLNSLVILPDYSCPLNNASEVTS